MTTENREQADALFSQAKQELERCRNAWASGNAGKGRVGARRAAGMAIRAYLKLKPDPAYGTNFMHHLAGVADNQGHPVALRESAHRLAARGWPENGFVAPVPEPLEPAADAASIIAWFRERCTSVTAESVDG